jgi:hypothetical protein
MDPSRRDAPQGNPLWAIYLPGKEVADFMGIKMIKEDKIIQVPTPHKWNKGLKKINTKLSEEDKCLVTFFHPNKILSDYEYLFYFARYLSLPIQNDGATLIHDISYHAWSVNLYPNDVTRLAATQTEVLLKFADFIDDEVSKMPESKKRIKDFYIAVKNKLLRKQVNAIDVGTAAINNSIGVPEKKQTILEAYQYYVKNGRSPRSTFIMLTGDLKFSILETATKNKATEADLLELRTTYNSLILKFYDNIGGIDILPDDSVYYSENELCDKISEKRTKLKKSVQEIYNECKKH